MAKKFVSRNWNVVFMMEEIISDEGIKAVFIWELKSKEMKNLSRSSHDHMNQFDAQNVDHDFLILLGTNFLIDPWSKFEFNNLIVSHNISQSVHWQQMLKHFDILILRWKLILNYISPDKISWKGMKESLGCNGVSYWYWWIIKSRFSSCIVLVHVCKNEITLCVEWFVEFNHRNHIIQNMYWAAILLKSIKKKYN